MVGSFDNHKFNDDLLLQDADRAVAAKKYPSIFHVLDHPELRNIFDEYDAPARRAKLIGLKAGLLAIGFGFGALAVAASEFLFTSPTTDHAVMRPGGWATITVATVSAMFGLLSVLIGSLGVLSAGRKREWLYRRLMTERVRQFHFQTLVFQLPCILASLKDDAAKSKFLSERALWFESFKQRLIGKLDSAFSSIIHEDEKVDTWLHDCADTRHHDALDESKDLVPLFDAYRDLRILHQIDFADYKLQDDYRIMSAAPRRQLRSLSQAVFIWIVLLFVMHVGVLIGVLFPASVFATFHSSEAIVVIIWLAMAALATRAVEQGLQPEREIERYQQYRSAVRALLERYDNASNQRSKIAIMRDMERLAFDEMRNFLITNERSRFVM